LDEVQYAPEVIAAVKRRIDRKRLPGQYILTGSQQWGVMKEMTESLTGRTALIQLEPFSLMEIAKNREGTSWFEYWLSAPEKLDTTKLSGLDLPRKTYEQLWRGFLPEAQTLPLDLIATFHSSYQKTYIERDIRLLADIPDLHQYTRFIRLSAALTAQEINYQELGRDLGIANQTARRWLSLLREIFEWHEISAFSMNTTKRISAKSKGYCSDTGQVCFSLAISTPNALGSSPSWGAIFETAVVNEIRKQLLFMGGPFNLYHWRSHAGAECDLIIERDGVYFPIEIKAKTKPSRSDTSGLAAFRKTYPKLAIAKGLVICLAETSYPLSEQDNAIPWNIILQ
jgi:predicted AAA+ superfamily ATPase